jgi:hypothetical protein
MPAKMIHSMLRDHLPEQFKGENGIRLLDEGYKKLA